MYVKEVVQWVLSNPDILELTFISAQMSTETRSYIHSIINRQIQLKEAINYDELPAELIKYDVGLVLYKGHILNYVYNVPNKVFEYLICGLKVLGDRCLKSTSKLNNPDILLIDFIKDLNSFDVKVLFGKKFCFNRFNCDLLINKYC
jgi:hypothetical protein